MEATATHAPALDRAPNDVADVIDVLPPRERLAWGFPVGCAIVAAVGFFVPYRFGPRLPPPEPSNLAAVSTFDPFAEDVPYSPEAIARAKPLVDPRWFLTPIVPTGHVRLGAPQVSGRLPTPVIERIVRQRFGRYRGCYQEGLRTNPNLVGRVAVRFVIGRDGAVTAVANGGSDLPDAAVIACIARTFQALWFPQPEGGIVVVTYPIMLSP